ncbi:anhydro-N-acetylmuramic acid kinase [Marinibactrum halimedae]|uniref:Anhydro-N-acetylmuramic acid kinase n=1 Tax=Marinibactrum halimedae TaxID=1444977 RepID=A0AA37T9C1_9GAMM|nr:anhydro-N-acetylmuramic acid kinase [Marinibactrum halimedae]MCD9460494.1 anhydro-N-acetylmuramic acid kinase [Marinibactrum halimedae]GLS25900.1 anhydro-N-acetylmuramic acid kinase [Marinibactrum halimedae]
MSLYIGLMSGTSMDGVDAALISIENNDKPTLIDSLTIKYPPELKTRLQSLALGCENELDLMGYCDREVASTFSQLCLQLLEKQNLKPEHINAIGSHGQTIRHRPSKDHGGPFTIQIGDPSFIAHHTGITTVADFRRKDMAAGGEGAPLAPAFHRALFGKKQHTTLVANIGGIANISVIPERDPTIGYDTGPGNTLLDGWIRRHKGLPFDDNGNWARTGAVNSSLLEALLKHPYFHQPHPKSTGLEEFNLTWVDAIIQLLESTPSPEDTQATLVELTAQTLSAAANIHEQEAETLYICGGGASNTFLMERLQSYLPLIAVKTSEAIGVHPDWVEAVGFAWLAHQTMHQLPGNDYFATGASQPVVLGGIYFHG